MTALAFDRSPGTRGARLNLGGRSASNVGARSGRIAGMSDGPTFMEVRGFNNRSPERAPARPSGTPLQTLIQLRKIEKDHASLEQQHQALRGLAIDQATKNEELAARNVSLEASLEEARANEKQARDESARHRQHASDLGRQLAEGHEHAQRRATDDSLKHWGLSVELEQSQERARRAEAGEAAARRESDELREALATSDARLRMMERTSAFAASLERASNISAAAANGEGQVELGGKGASRSRVPSTGETGASGGGEHSSFSMPLTMDAARAAATPAHAAEQLFGPPLQPLLSRANGAVAAATAGASVCSTPRSGSFKSSYLSTGASRHGSRANSRRPSSELEDAGGAGTTPSWSIGGSSAPSRPPTSPA